MDSFFLGGGEIYSRKCLFVFVSGSGDDGDLPGEGIGGCTFQMLVYCRSLVGVTCNVKEKTEGGVSCSSNVFYDILKPRNLLFKRNERKRKKERKRKSYHSS